MTLIMLHLVAVILTRKHFRLWLVLRSANVRSPRSCYALTLGVKQYFSLTLNSWNMDLKRLRHLLFFVA